MKRRKQKVGETEEKGKKSIFLTIKYIEGHIFPLKI